MIFFLLCTVTFPFFNRLLSVRRTKMDYTYIEQLLERYWACETSLQEEGILRNFFAQDDVPAHLQRYQAVFQAETIGEEQLSDDFEERLMARIEGSENVVDAKDVFVAATPVKAKTLHFGYRLRPILKAAAMVAVVLSISMAVQQAMEQQNEAEAASVQRAQMAEDAQKPVTGTTIETAYGQAGETLKPDSLSSVPEGGRQ